MHELQIIKRTNIFVQIIINSTFVMKYGIFLKRLIHYRILIRTIADGNSTHLSADVYLIFDKLTALPLRA